MRDAAGQAHGAKAKPCLRPFGSRSSPANGASRPPLLPRLGAAPERGEDFSAVTFAMRPSASRRRDRRFRLTADPVWPDSATGYLRPRSNRPGTLDRSHRISTPYAPKGARFPLLHNELARKRRRVCCSTRMAGREIGGNRPFLRSMRDYAGRGHDDQLARDRRGRYK